LVGKVLSRQGELVVETVKKFVRAGEHTVVIPKIFSLSEKERIEWGMGRAMATGATRSRREICLWEKAGQCLSRRHAIETRASS
jgi:hypothetical protein